MSEDNGKDLTENPAFEVNEEGGVSLPAWQPLRLSARHMMMIELHLRGFKNTEIADMMRCHEVTVGLVLRSQPAQDVLAARVEDLQMEFKGQFRQVVDTFADALHPDADIDTRLTAADKWLKAQGYYQPKPKPKDDGALSIEDVIKEIREGNVTINVDNRKQTYYNSPPTGVERWPVEQTPPSQTSKEDSPPEAEVSEKRLAQRR